MAESREGLGRPNAAEAVAKLALGLSVGSELQFMPDCE